MALEVTSGIYPPGGYKFTDAEGTAFEASNLKDLVQALWAYRRRLGKPPGNPYREITDALCAKAPHLCREGGRMDDFVMRLQQRAVKWLDAKDKGKLRIMSTIYAAERSDICLRCPRRVGYVAPCQACEQNLRDVLFAALHPAKPDGNLAGHACLLAEDELSAAVWIDHDEPLANAPECCWRRHNK